MKHIQIDIHFVRDLVAKKILNVQHVHTTDQLADLLTKPLSGNEQNSYVTRLAYPMVARSCGGVSRNLMRLTLCQFNRSCYHDKCQILCSS